MVSLMVVLKADKWVGGSAALLVDKMGILLVG
jgi:hypothetical protein